MTPLTICYQSSQWRTLDPVLLRESVCVVIDVIRATSTIVTALAQGAGAIQPVADSSDAYALKALNRDFLLAGERKGQPLPGFDLGNSPEEFTADRVGGRHIILTTTNGTQALAACQGARAILTASFLNLDAVVTQLRALGAPWIIVCAGFEGHFGLDDAILAGALAEALEQDHPLVYVYRSVRHDLLGALQGSLAGRELAKVGLEKDLLYCAQLNALTKVPMLNADGVLV